MTQVEKEVARLLRQTWTPPKALPETGIDLLLVKAYKTAAELQLHARRLDRQHGEAVEPETQPLIDRRLDMLDFILTTPANGLRSAQVKLRVLLDPRAGLAAGRGIHDITAIKQVSMVISREMDQRRRARAERRAKP
jgi:hypothetical protein